MATGSVNINSGIHQLPSNCYPPSESDDEDSFVVLSNSLGPDIIKDSVIHTEPISTTIIESSLDSVSEVLAKASMLSPSSENVTVNSVIDGVQSTYSSTEFSPEEIQRKVDDLIAENTKLKDTLAQNNIAMKKQVDTLAQWQQDVQRVQESHKEKFAEMKKYISILKAENVLLKNATSLSDNKPVQELKQTTSETVSRKNIMEFELEGAKKRIEELEKALDQLSLEKEDLLKTHLKKQKDSSLMHELERLDSMNEKLNKELVTKKQDQAKLDDEISMLKSEKAVADKEIENLKQTVMELGKVTDELNLEKQRSDDQVFKLKTSRMSLAKTNDDLTRLLQILQAEVENNHRKLTDEISSLQNAAKESSNFQETLDNIRQQLMASQMHITELKQQNAKSIAEKDEEIKQLQKQLKDSLIAEDEFTALRAQVDLYKTDFEIERRSKESILTEKNKIVDDLSHLQRRNQQLLEEVEQLRAGFVCVQKEEVQPTSSAPPNSKFSCPRCSFRFSNYQALENHVFRCIELDTLP